MSDFLAREMREKIMKKYWIIAGLAAVILCVGGCEKAEEKNSKPVEASVSKTEDKDNDPEKEQTMEENKGAEPEPWTPIPIDQAPADYNCEFCLGCGKTNDEVTVTKWGYCNACFDKFRPFGSCTVCGTTLDGSDTAHYDGTRCISDASRCDYCGTELDESTFSSMGQYVDSLCYARYIVGCQNCGAKNNTVDASTGLCAECGGYNYCSLCGAYMPNGESWFDSGYRFCQSCVDTYGGENLFDIKTGQY